MTALPDGFVLDKAATQLPEGFALDPTRPSPAGTAGYIGTRTLGGFLEGGKQLAAAASLEMGQNEQAQELQGLPSGQETANKAVYGAPNIPEPNAVAGYLGDVGSAFGANPVLGGIAPGYTTASALGGRFGSDVNRWVGAPLHDWVARLAGGMMGGAGYGLLKNAATNAFNNATNPAPFASEKDVARALEQKGRLGETLIGQYQEPAQVAADAVGPQTTPAQIGKTLLDRAQTWLGNQKAAASQDFQAIEGQFPEGSRILPTRTRDLLQTPAEGPPLPAIAGQLKDQLGKSGSLPYPAIKQWRTAVGSAMENDSSLRPLYNALTEDMKGALQAQGGPQAVTAFENANSGYRTAQNFIEDRLGKLGDASLPPERLRTLIQNPASHATELGDLLNAGVINQGDVATLARGWLEKAGRNAQGLWDPAQLTKNFATLQMQSPEAVRLLFGNAPPEFSTGLEAARNLSATVEPLAQANMPRPGLLRRALPAVVGMGIGKMGVPGAELGTGWILGHGVPPNVNPLYALPRQPSPYLSPLMGGASMGLLNSAQQPNGLLGP